MKRFTSFFLAICLSASMWGQNVPAQMWFDSGMLFFGDKSAYL